MISKSDLEFIGPIKLNEFTEFINSLYPTIKFTMVSSEVSLNVLDLTLLLVDGFIQTDIYSKPTDHHIYLLRNSAHPSHCTKAIPFGVATRVRRNCSTIERFEERSKEYQKYLVDRGYNPSKVQKQFDIAKTTPREDLLSAKMRERKVLFPLVVDFNPHLPNIGKIIQSYSHLLYDSPTLAQTFPKGSIIPSSINIYIYIYITRVSRLLVGCLNHSATEPTTLATQLEIDLIVIRSGETYQHIFCSQDHLTTPRSIGDSQSYSPEERNKY